jgi:microcystin-dependent protein
MRPGVLPGEIRLIAGSYAPDGWATCDGSQRKVADDQELFKAIGATYGGDGKTNFALPNFQAQVPIHAGAGVKAGQIGQGGIRLSAHAAKLRYVIALRPQAWGEPFLGEVRNYAFNFAPNKWARCEGQLLPIAGYTALFSLLMETYGGDGTRTFALPDLRGTAIGGDGLRCVGTNYCIATEGIFPSRG